MSERIDDDEFYARQGEALKKLADALIEATPDWWDEATLNLRMTEEGCEHSITSFAHPSDIVTPTIELFEATGELEQVFRERREPWTAARFNVWREGDAWEYSIDYMY